MSHSIQPVLLAQRQHAERRRIGDHDEVAGARHLVEAHAAAGGEHREHRAVRGVLGEQRRRHGDAGAHGVRGLRRDQRLAAQHAVLIAERKAHDFELAPLDLALDRGRGAALLGAPQVVAVDEAREDLRGIGHRRVMPRAGQPVARELSRRSPADLGRGALAAHSPSSRLALVGRSSANSPASRRSGRCRRSRRGR